MPATAGTVAPADLIRDGVAAYRAGAPARALGLFREASLASTDALSALWAGVAAAATRQWEVAASFFRGALQRPHTAAEDRIARAWLARLAALSAPPQAERPGTPEAVAALARAVNPRLTLGQARWLGLAVVTAAKREGLDPWLLASVIYTESRFNHASVSWAGAIGLGQLMPDTARAAGVDPVDPWGNILGTAEILRWNYLTFRNWTLALAAYNAGSDAVRRYGGIPPYAETRIFVNLVLETYRQVRAAG